MNITEDIDGLFRVKPEMIRLDVCSVCQLQCPCCGNPSGLFFPPNGETRGMVSAADFGRLLTANPGLEAVDIANHGEIFLNPDLPAIMEIAAERGVRLMAQSGVNMNHLPDAAAEALVKFGLRKISVSIDGARQETYSQYRRGGDFGRVIGNIKKINALKKKHNSPYPRLRWQFIVFGHNERDLPEARRMARELGMRFAPKKNSSINFSPIQDRAWVSEHTGWPNPDERDFRRENVRSYVRHVCCMLWAPQFDPAGKLFGCCINTDQPFVSDSVFAAGAALSDIANRPLLTDSRRALFGLGPMPKGSPCVKCNLFKLMKQSGKWMTREFLNEWLRNQREQWEA